MKLVYQNAVCQSEKWSKIVYFLITRVVPISIIWPKVIISVCVYFVSDSGNSPLMLPTPTWYIYYLSKLSYINRMSYFYTFFDVWIRRFPFNSKSPTGYSLAVIIEYLITTCMCYFVGSLFILGISSYLMVIPVMKDIKVSLCSINDIAKSHKDQLATIKQFSDFIPFHSWAKQLSIS